MNDSCVAVFLLALVSVFSTSPAQLAKGPKSGSISRGVVMTTDGFSASLSAAGSTQNGPEEGEVREPRTLSYSLSAPVGSSLGAGVIPSRRADWEMDAVPVIAPLNIVAGFQGLRDIGESGATDAVMAAGPNHIMACVNRRFAIWTKNGTLLKTISAPAWFASALGPGTWFIVDPRIRYDHFANRWVMVWLADNRPTRSIGYQLISVSDDDNPLGTWYNWAVPSNTVGDSLVTNLSDFPGLGFDENAFYVTTDQTSPTYAYVYDRIRIFDKTQFYANSAGPVSWTDYWDLREPDNLTKKIFTIRPAIIFGSPGVAFFLNQSPYTTISNPGTFFTLWKLTNPLTSPNLSAVNIDVGPYLQTPTTFGQLGGTTVQTFSWSDQSGEPVYRDSCLWAVHDIASGTGNQYSSIRYVRIDPFREVLLEDVTFGEDSSWYILPSLMVDKDGIVIITSSRSSPTEYIGAFCVVNPGKPVFQTGVFKEGQSTFSRASFRWGDYMGIGIDPAQDSTVWMFTQYAEESGWGTWIAQLKTTLINGIHDNIAGGPTGFHLEQNYPNPFNPTTTIGFTLHASLFTCLSIYNVLGQEVAGLVNDNLDAGTYNVSWDATGFPSGMYYYMLKAGEFAETKKLVLVR